MERALPPERGTARNRTPLGSERLGRVDLIALRTLPIGRSPSGIGRWEINLSETCPPPLSCRWSRSPAFNPRVFKGGPRMDRRGYAASHFASY